MALAGSQPFSLVPARRLWWKQPRAVALLAVGIALAWLLLGPLAHWPHAARATLAVFALSICAWTLLRWDETAVALAAALALVALGVVPLAQLHASLGHELIWLLLGAFVLAVGWRESGLIERWIVAALGEGRPLGSLFRRLTWLIFATAFVVPSTSARAALLLPVLTLLWPLLPAGRARVGMALLFPTIVLLSAGASYLGAGAHLVAVDAMQRLGGPAPDFVQWTLWAAPFAALSCWLACETLLCLFAGGGQRSLRLTLPQAKAQPLTAHQRRIVMISGVALAAWASTPWHGLDAALVALAAALAITCKPLTGLTMKRALRQVEWPLLWMLALTLLIGEALVSSGASQALAQALQAQAWLHMLGGPALLLLAALLALLSHLVITSRTARAVVLIPTVAVPLSALGADPGLLIFVCVLASGFCQTFQISAKPLAVFVGSDEVRYSSADLLRLALYLLPGQMLLLAVFGLWVWPAMGLGAALN